MPQNATEMVATARTPWKADALVEAPSLFEKLSVICHIEHINMKSL